MAGIGVIPPVAGGNAPGPRQAARACSTANVALTSMPSAVDGVTLAAGDRFLAVAQTSNAENGIYVFHGAGNAATRASDASTATTLASAFLFVTQGATYAGTGWECTNAATLTLGVDPINWVQFDQTAVPSIKGDIIVGTGASGAARLPVGPDGYVLTADSTQSGGLAYSSGSGASLPTAPASTKSGYYYFCNSRTQASTGSPSINQPRVSPWLVDKTIVIARLGVEFTVAGSADSTFRIGIWNDDGQGFPSTVALDAGTISTGTGNAGTVATGGTPGSYEITLGASLTLPKGLYHVGGVAGGTTAATFRTLSTAVNDQIQLPYGTSIPAAGQTFSGYAGQTQSGSLAAFTSWAALSTTVRVFYRTA